MRPLIPTASQTVGPFFHVGLCHPHWDDLMREGAQGRPIRIRGRVTDGEGDPVPDALIEIWQADADGCYARPHEMRAPHRGLFRGFGRAPTDAEGRYAFRTVMPGSVRGANGESQAPHINVVIFARGLLRHLNTRMYFSDRAHENERDVVLASAPPQVRKTLMAQLQETAGDADYVFDIRLQGEGETAFFDA